MDDLVKKIASYSYRFVTEDQLQRCIENVLSQEGYDFKREHCLSPTSRIDFLVGSIGVEVKIKGSAASLTRQVHRYAQFDQISAIVVVTTLARLTKLPPLINGKRIAVALLVDSCL